MEHLKPLLEDPETTDAFTFICGRYAQAAVPQEVGAAMSLCNMTALNKDSPGHSLAHGVSTRVRGLAVGDIVRRLVGRTLAQQYQVEFEVSFLPLLQYLHHFVVIGGVPLYLY